MEMVIIRHGQTAGNLAGRYIGRTDEPLCAEGIAAVRKMGSFQGLDRVYVSPLRRTRETAALLFPDSRQIFCPDLREMDFGDFEGKNAEDMVGNPAYQAWVASNCLEPCPNGESLAGLTVRVSAAFSAIIEDNIRQGSLRLAIVAHGGTIMVLMQEFARPGLPFHSWHVPNASGFKAQIDAQAWLTNQAITDYERLEVLDW